MRGRDREPLMANYNLQAALTLANELGTGTLACANLICGELQPLPCSRFDRTAPAFCDRGRTKRTSGHATESPRPHNSRWVLPFGCRPKTRHNGWRETPAAAGGPCRCQSQPSDVAH